MAAVAGPRSDSLSGVLSDAAVGWVIDRYRPPGISPAAAGFARGVVSAAGPATPARAKALLFAAGRLACFAEGVGLELDGALLAEPVIERFILVGCEGLAPASVRTLRANLRALARSLERYPQPAAVALVRERGKAPYSDAEIDGYLRLAQAQSTERRRRRCQALICLGAGAGVIAGELRDVRGTDVVCRSGGVLVLVSGRRTRSVPVLYRYRQPLLEVARFAGERLICGGREPGRRNVSDALCAALSADRSLPRLEVGRLRSSWLVECARQIGLAAFMHAAGIRCSQRLGDLVAGLPVPGEEDLIALLGQGA